MGPILIFDKSVLESLNPDESVWLDQFFITNITPVFFVETLADLKKEAELGRTPEDIVGSLAYKTPDLHAKANVHHRSLLEGELSGQGKINIDNGHIYLGGGKYIDLGGKTGVMFEESPEEESLRRWQEHRFLDIERSHAKEWREALSNIDFEEIYNHYQIRFSGQPKPKTIEDVKKIVDELIDSPDQEQILMTGLSLIGASPNFQQEIFNRWQAENRPMIRNFAPYFTYILTVDLVFYFGIGADLIGRGRPSHKIDVAYLYYLPFCAVFTSNDRLHELLVPIFLRANQSFVPGVKLKEDFKKLDAHYDALPAETKVKGFYFFASTPPHDSSFLVTQLWDKHMSSKWRNIRSQEPQHNSPSGEWLSKRIKEFEKKVRDEGTSQPVGLAESDELVIKRMVSTKRGKWTRFSPEIINRQKNKDGDWEDKLTAN